MDTKQITALLARDPRTKSIFLGVVPIDGLPTTIDAFPIASVCNTDDGDEPDEQWIALYLDANRCGEYFCSYGLPPLHATFRTFMNKHCYEWTHNTKILHSPLSNVCGQNCVAYSFVVTVIRREHLSIYSTPIYSLTIIACLTGFIISKEAYVVSYYVNKMSHNLCCLLISFT